MKLVLVGESWGRHEARWQHPLVWWSGRELARMMTQAGMAPALRVRYPTESDMIDHWKWLHDEHQIAVTNVFQEHPAGDDTTLFFGRTPTTDLPPIKIAMKLLHLLPEHKHHIDRMWHELEEWNPNVVVALGNYACWALLHRSGITAIRGTPKTSIKLNLKVIPTFHPAALRDEKLRPTIVADLQKARRESEYPEIRRIERWAVAEDPRTKRKVTLDEIESWFAQPSDNYTIDIETGYKLFTRAELRAMTGTMRRILSELISMVSFARSPYESVIIPFMTRDDEQLNYWTKPDEARAWKILIRELSSDIPKTFQNGIFDISVFLMNRIIVMNCTDDPMIASHARTPELLKGLGYLASIHTREISWKEMGALGETLKRDE